MRESYHEHRGSVVHDLVTISPSTTRRRTNSARRRSGRSLLRAPAVLVAVGALASALGGCAAATPVPAGSSLPTPAMSAPSGSASASRTPSALAGSASPSRTPSASALVTGAMASSPASSSSRRPTPAKPGLDPRLRAAFARAQRDARAQGVTLRINSGYRSAALQQRLFKAAVKRYGSRAAARKWVAPPSESYHVKGLAVDVAPYSGAAWLQKRQARYGLCRVFANEWWHFELNQSGRRCPPLLSSAAARRP